MSNLTFRLFIISVLFSVLLSTVQAQNIPTENIIWVYSVILLFLASLIIVFVVCLKIKSKLNKELDFKSYPQPEFGSMIRRSYVNASHIEEEENDLICINKRMGFPRNNIQRGVQISLGEFCDIFKAEANGLINKDTTTTVAVISVKTTIDPFFRKSIVCQLKIKAEIYRHLHLVNLLGVCTESVNKEIMIIEEYCCFGNIQQLLVQHRDRFLDQITPDDNFLDSLSLDELEPVEHEFNVNSDKNTPIKPLRTRDLICWSWQIARGMEYLASIKIVHGNLTTRNILLAENNVIKIGDFGLVNKTYISELFKKRPAEVYSLVKRMAIESIRDRVFSTESDVWAFGIVLWEIFSLANPPYQRILAFDLLDKLIHGYRMEQPKYANFKLYSTMLDCWEKDPVNRPSFLNLSERLGDLLHSSTKSHYIDLNLVYLRINSEKSLQLFTHVVDTTT